MPAKNKTNLGLATVFLPIRRCVHVLYVGINALARLVLPKNMGARLASNQNAAIFNDFWQSRTKSYFMYYKREFGKKGVNISVLAGFELLLAGILIKHFKESVPVIAGEEVLTLTNIISNLIAIDLAEFGFGSS